MTSSVRIDACPMWALLGLLLWTCQTCCWSLGDEFCGTDWQSGLQPSEEVLQAQQSRIQVIAAAMKSAVCIFGPGGQGGGSGVVVTPDGYTLTNYHVAQPCGMHLKCGLPDGVLYDAVLVGIDPTGDVALIKLLGRDDFPAAEWGDSDLLRPGEPCFAIGNPFLLATDFQPTVTWGIVSGIHRYQYPSGTLLEYTDCIQTDAAINPGNSGGPLFNSQGQLVGVNGRASFEKRGRVNVGAGYAISINQIKYFFDHLLAGRIVDHSTLGATLATNQQGQVTVSNILEASDAYRRGLRFDDEIIQFGGREIQTVNEFKNILGIYPQGWRVPLVYKRDGVLHEIGVRLSGVHASDELIELIQGPLAQDAPPEELPPDNKIPDHVAALIKPRKGFANYYFNLIRQQQLWEALIEHGDFRQHRLQWRIFGTASSGSKMTIVLSDSRSGIQWGEKNFVLDPNLELAAQLQPDNTSTVLFAFHLWRRLLVGGTDQFGDLHYFGSLPLLRQGLQVDVLVGSLDVIETNFLLDRQTGLMVGLEMYPDVGGDACQLFFHDYQIHDDLTVPGQIEIIIGDQPIETIEIEKIEFAKEQ